MTISLVLAKEGDECRCRDPWAVHEAFRWIPPADGTSHVIIELGEVSDG